MGKVALVFGANGVSGLALLEALFEQPKSEWSKIISVSRRPPQLDHKDDRVHHISIDLLHKSTDDLASEIDKAGGREVTHAFHYTYIEKSDENELIEVNRTLFKTALDACASACPKLQVFQLQTGYKYYGVHLGGKELAPRPFKEDAPRHSGANFYFIQEDMLQEAAFKNKWKYVITRPNIIIGIAKGNYMNFAVSVGLYAALQKELGRPLVFPGNGNMYNQKVDFSPAINNARFQAFCATNPKAYNQIFNIASDQDTSFSQIWPKIADYFGIPVKAEFTKEAKEGMVSEQPLAEYMPANQQKWEEIAKKKGLDPKAYEYATWAFVALFEQPKSEWSKIISISRRPPQMDHKDDRVHHISIDLLHKSTDDLASEFDKGGGKEVTRAFFYAYIQKADGKELIAVNRDLLKNALDTCASACPRMQVFELQTEYKASFIQLWPKIADYFGIPVKAEFTKEVKDGTFSEQPLAEYVPAKQQQWEEIATRGFVDAGTCCTWPFEGNLSKARSVGWDITFDTWESFRQIFDKMTELKFIPK
ncbi:hypothetical protein BZG36_03877 [Bifiguratus adelaidae]|uniref:PRISE-like Rossmann-fold domain-containing protein n=1 Tax=Bifiguratus adelaidae TaxID=1938954 RepID=A0A261XXM9_9FUNG|nr:hypothetical protein BZG36_03877 [Bifiguratus adelaidae]